MLQGDGGGSDRTASGARPDGRASATPLQLGDYLVEQGLIAPDQLQDALQQQEADGDLLGEILVARGYLIEDELARALARMAGVPFHELRLDDIEAAAIQAVPRTLPSQHRLVPLRVDNGSMWVAFADPFDVLAVDEVERHTGLKVRTVCATETDIRTAVDHFYGGAGVLEGLVAETIERQESDRRQVQEGGVVIAEPTMTSAEPMVRLVDELIEQGVRRRATDIHIEPEDGIVRTRFRVDGMLMPGPTLPRRLHEPMLSRVKIIADLDIAEQRLPQEGHITYRAMGHEVDLRVSVFPTVFGEKAALRLLERQMLFRGLGDLGLEGTTLEKLNESLRTSKGIMLLTGPTGSGKTTTLYAMLSSLDMAANNNVTLEDPVEYRIAQIRQRQINPRAGFTFATGLRSILRQDPDVIMVGEIRDPETAGLAMRAALTGIMVFSTLHTNEAAGTFPRLVDMGMEPYLIGSTMIAAVAERLVRKTCRRCAERVGPDMDLLARLGLENEEITGDWLRGLGCRYCAGTGYLGRTGIFEILTVTDAIRELIQTRADSGPIRRAAIADGMETLLQHGLTLVRRGETTLEELARVARE